MTLKERIQSKAIKLGTIGLAAVLSSLGCDSLNKPIDPMFQEKIENYHETTREEFLNDITCRPPVGDYKP